MRGRSALKIGSVVCALALALAGCSSGGSSENSSGQGKPTNAQSAAPDSLAKVTVGITGLNASHLWAVAATAEKTMEPAGIDLQLVSFQGTSNIIPAVLSQSVNFGVLPVNGAMAAAEKGPNLKLVAGTVVGNSASLVVSSKIHSWDDLKGKKISSNNPGTSSDYFTMSAILLKHGLHENKDFTFVAGGSTTSRVAALLSGAVDALLVQPPDTYRLKDQGARILSTPEDDRVQGKYLAIAIGSNKEWYSKNRDTAVKFLKGYQDTIRWLSDPANRTKAGADFAKAFNVSQELGERTWDAYFAGPDAFNKNLDKTGAIDLATLQKTLENAKEQNDALIKDISPSDLPKFFDNSLAQEAAK